MADVISDARRALLEAAHDARTKLFKFDVVLLSISDALGELQRRSDAQQLALERLRDTEHGATCECKLCSLARMVKYTKGAA